MDRGSPAPARTDPRMIVAMSLGGVRGAVTLAGVHGADTRADIRSRARPRAHLISDATSRRLVREIDLLEERFK
jgi:NhaP-type Na+/H+ or K+/H+ antiporter